MNVAVIFAGGTGQRMKSGSLPKQFMEHCGKPILVYTLEKFQQHLAVDAIVVVMLEDWIGHTEDLISAYGLTKVCAVVPGGKTGQESIYHGLKKAAEIFPSDSVVLIHDGVRPFIDEETISNAILCVELNGSAITTAPAVETIALSGSEGLVQSIIERSSCRIARAPQCFRLGEILACHQRALAGGESSFIDSASLMMHYGYPLHCVPGPAENIKITTRIDYAMFCAIIDAQADTEGKRYE